MIDSTQTDAAQTAANELAARGEEPPRRRGGARKGAGRKKKVTTPTLPTEAEIQTYAFLAGTLWGISARIFKLEDITDEERLQLGEAIAPVVAKYLPQFEQYAPEANLIILVGGLVLAKRKKKPQPDQNGDTAPDLELVPPDQS